MLLPVTLLTTITFQNIPSFTSTVLPESIPQSFHAGAPRLRELSAHGNRDINRCKPSMNRTASRATGQPSQEKIIGQSYGSRPEGDLRTSGSDMHPITCVMAYHTPQFIKSNSLSGDVAADGAGILSAVLLPTQFN